MSAEQSARNASSAPSTTSAETSKALDAVDRLERELRKQSWKRWVRRGVWLVGLVLLGVGFVLWRKSNEPEPTARFRGQALEVRDITEQVDSTGRLKPLKEVQVGAQVSGRVVDVLVDFNSQVEKGQLLAEIDPQLFGAQVGQVSGQLEAAEANLQRADANVEAAKLELERVQRLGQEGLASQAELDQRRTAAEVAKAEASAAKATINGLRSQLRSARATLTYTKIHSPINGIVIHREIEPGQTVAASFSAPVLFIIAEDLSKMEVLAEVDEADVGKLKEGLEARVTVDAFPGEVFEGKVTQIRYSPNEVQGVVTYSAVVNVGNPKLTLRPGMTATVSITTRKVTQVLAAPNAALRFEPEEKETNPTTLEPGQARAYHVTGGPVGQEEVEPLIVQTGITDGLWTEVKGAGLPAGQELVTEQTDKEEKTRRFMGLF